MVEWSKTVLFGLPQAATPNAYIHFINGMPKVTYLRAKAPKSSHSLCASGVG